MTQFVMAPSHIFKETRFRVQIHRKKIKFIICKIIVKTVKPTV